ncbi:dihydropteroate synthase [Propionibacterium ruminifibrarum]|uniref:Dihydropteroate synthase n=1 Tax=Propionibacterium ruminifibrarum TaxID=1962131 RepID=A0A375I467_9ACTN|nr:dihydropteroate synthase [Propionibacterium ruminifibrarum]SPF67993.1 dihydropteroate synthase [Propionibacterium ruminifibrarum]
MSHTSVMGIINVTPDSFSDGGMWPDAHAGVGHGLELIAQGAAILDVGGESTRPGAERVSEAEELARVVPVIEGLRVPATATGVQLSVDTMRASVARAAVQAGATIVNDVSGGLADEAMLDTVANLGVDYVCQHWRGFGQEMDAAAEYDDVVAEVRDELQARCQAAVDAGIAPERIIADPGLGFAKTAGHDWQILAHLEVFTGLGHRVLIGASRKRFLGNLLRGRPATERDAATTAVSGWCCAHGVWAVRTHEVRSQVDAITVIEHLLALAN